MNGNKYMGLIASLPCAICGSVPVEVHHRRAGTGAGRASDFDTYPLCYEHHRGNGGIHGMGTKKFQATFGDEESHVIAARLRLGITSEEVETWKQEGRISSNLSSKKIVRRIYEG
jgi:hypothetical protein